MKKTQDDKAVMYIDEETGDAYLRADLAAEQVAAREAEVRAEYDAQYERLRDAARDVVEYLPELGPCAKMDALRAALAALTEGEAK